MDELINMIAQRTGISVEQAREATNMVVSFLKERLPEPLAAQVDTVLTSQSFGEISDQVQKGLGGLGNLFG